MNLATIRTSADAGYDKLCARCYSLKTTRGRASMWRRLILNGSALGTRAYDALFECGDGQAVAELCESMVANDVSLARAVIKHGRYVWPEMLKIAQETLNQ